MAVKIKHQISKRDFEKALKLVAAYKVQEHLEYLTEMLEERAQVEVLEESDEQEMYVNGIELLEEILDEDFVEDVKNDVFRLYKAEVRKMYPLVKDRDFCY